MQKINKRNFVKKIFDDISYRYDLLNRILSFGVDIYWRKKAIKKSNFSQNSILLDLACGTGDFSAEARKRGVKNIFAADLSFNMIKLFLEKRYWIKDKILQCEAEALPYKNNSFDGVICSFGIRNFHNLNSSFDEIFRILKKNGKIVILDFQLPKRKLFAKLYMLYYEKVLPIIGGFISKNFNAYKYLPESTKEFDSLNLSEMLKIKNFNKIEKFELTFGIVQLIIAEK